MTERALDARRTASRMVGIRVRLEPMYLITARSPMGEACPQTDRNNRSERNRVYSGTVSACSIENHAKLVSRSASPTDP